jgi:arylsulfatase A-like enzyme
LIATNAFGIVFAALICQSNAVLLFMLPADPAGWDFLNSAEATAGEVMSAAGYRTAQFGKWHNREVSGYEPWSVGFHEGELPAANRDCPVK